MKLYEECETCNIHKIQMYCMIVGNVNYKKIALKCPCRECLLKTICSDICRARNDVWRKTRKNKRVGSIILFNATEEKEEKNDYKKAIRG
jgi:hypothetical protein